MLPEKTGKTASKKNKNRQAIAVIVYIVVLTVAALNWAAPSSAFPGVSFNSWSPQSVSWQLTIPPGPPSNFFSFINTTTIINVTISASQTFADGVDITINAAACEKPTPVGNNNVTFTQLLIGFNGAYPTTTKYGLSTLASSAFNGESLTALSYAKLPPGYFPTNCPSSLGKSAIGFDGQTDESTVYFQNPGTYPIVIRGNDFGNFSFFQYNYTSNAIDVQSSALLNQGVVLRAEALVVLATFAFGIFEAIPIIRKNL